MFFRIVFPLLVVTMAIIWILDIPERLKRIALLITFPFMVISGVIFTLLLFDTGGPIANGGLSTPVPTAATLPTVTPEGPGFESACKAFDSLYRDVQAGILSDHEIRTARIDEVRRLADFRGSTARFTGNIVAYSVALDRLYAQGDFEGMPAGDELSEVERQVRFARDEVLSECRAHQP